MKILNKTTSKDLISIQDQDLQAFIQQCNLMDSKIFKTLVVLIQEIILKIKLIQLRKELQELRK